MIPWYGNAAKIKLDNKRVGRVIAMSEHIQRRRPSLALLLLALLAIAIPDRAVASEEFDKVRLRYATFLPASHTREVFLQKWMEEVTKRSGGAVTFDAFRDQALLQTTALLDGASRGISDISYVAAGYHPSELPLTTLMDLPYLTNNSQALMLTVQQMLDEFPDLKKEHDSKNVALLGSVPGDPTILGTQEAWKTLADIKGKRIRAFGLINQTLVALGAVPVALPAPEIYASMERRVIEGYSGFPASLITPMALHEVTKFVIDYGAGNYANVAIFMNKRRFDGLKPKTRALLLESFAELARASYIADISKVNKERAKALTDSKLEFVRWSKEDRETARKIVSEKVWEEAIKTREARGVKAARAFVERFLVLVKENEKKATDYIDPVSVALGAPD
jgi:TRAP-type transport system periplasmic protein